MYQKYSLKRVFYSAYIPVTEDTRLPALDTKPPLLREHRLYQADWLLRFYQFKADEILDEENQSFNPYLDPKCNWAVQHYGLFPVDVHSISSPAKGARARTRAAARPDGSISPGPSSTRMCSAAIANS